MINISPALTGFTFRGVYSGSFGAVMRTKSRPLLPEVKKVIVEAPMRDGAYDFTDINYDSRAHYNTRTISISFTVTAKDIYNLNDKLAEISSWLTGKGELIFDDRPNAIWTGRVMSVVDYAPERSGTKAIISVGFECEPFASGTYDVAEGIVLGTGIALYTDTEIGVDEAANYTKTWAYASTISYRVMTINNPGSAPIGGKIIITNSSNQDITVYLSELNANNEPIDLEGNIITDNQDSTLSSTNPNPQKDVFGNKKTLRIAHTTTSTEKIIIDCDKKSIVNGSGVSPSYEGNFFEFAPGTSVLVMITQFAFSATVSFVPKYMF